MSTARTQNRLDSCTPWSAANWSGSGRRPPLRQCEDGIMRFRWLASLVVFALPAAASAQWLNYPTPGVPRTADGKPDMSAPTPRTADGKPDFTGMWGWETRANCGARCNDFQISREFMNIAASLQ